MMKKLLKLERARENDSGTGMSFSHPTMNAVNILKKCVHMKSSTNIEVKCLFKIERLA